MFRRYADFSAASRFAGLGFRTLIAVVVTLCLPTRSVGQTASVVGWDAPATTVFSSLNTPESLAVDVNGAVYVADTSNERIIQLVATSSGYQIHATIASTATFGKTFIPTGVAVDAALNVYAVAYGTPGALYQFPWTGTGYGAPVTLSTAVSPLSNVTVDGGENVYVADAGAARILRIPWNGTAFGAATTAIGITGPGERAIAVDGDSNLYYSNYDGSAILQANWNGTGYNTPVTAVSGLTGLRGVATDTRGNLYFSTTSGVYSAALSTYGYSAPFQMGGTSKFGQVWDVAAGATGLLFALDNQQNTLSSIPLPGYFGSQPVDAPGTTRNLTLSFNADATIQSHTTISTLASPNVLRSSYDFVDSGGCGPSFYQAGDTCSVAVTFTAHRAGTASGAFDIYDKNGIPLFALPLNGYGVGPQVAFSGLQTYFAGPGPAPYAFDGNGNLFYAVFANPAANSSVQEAVWNGVGFNPPVTVLAGVVAEGIGLDGGGNLYVADGVSVSVIKVPRTITSTSVSQPSQTWGPPVTLWSGPQPVFTTVTVCGEAIYLFSLIPGSAALLQPYQGVCETISGYSVAVSINLFQLAVDNAGDVFFEAQTSAQGEDPNDGLGLTLTKLPVTTTGYGTPQIIGTSHLEQVLLPKQASLPLAVDANGNVFLSVTSSANIATVWESAYNGTSYGVFQPVLTGLVPGDFGNFIAVDSNDNVYATSADFEYSNRVRRATYNGSTWVPSTAASVNNQELIGLALDLNGNPWVVTDSTIAFGTPSFSKLDITSFPSLTFPTATFVGQTDTADGSLAATLYNIGNQPLPLDPVYPASFPASGTDLYNGICGSNLAVGENCDLAVNFAPQTAGQFSVSATWTTTTPGNQPRVLYLSGVGKATSALAFATTPTAAIETGGNAGNAVTIVAENLGSIVSTATPLVTLTVTGPNGYAKTYTATAVAGVATFDLSGAALAATGTYSYSASASTYASATAAETVVAAVTTSLAFGTAPTSVVLTGGNAGSAITVLELDSAGVLRTSASDAINLSLTYTDGSTAYSMTYTANASGGIATFNLSGAALSIPGTYTYTASSGTLKPATASEMVNIAPLDFGRVNVGTSTAALPVTLAITLNTIGLRGDTSVLTQGATGGDFSFAPGGTCAFYFNSLQNYNAGQTCTVNVIFKPSAAGLRSGAVELVDGYGNVVAQQYISGFGAGPRAAFNSQQTTSVYSATSAFAAGVAVDGVGNVFVADRANNTVVELPWNGTGYGSQISEGDVRTLTYAGTPLTGQLWINPGQVAVDGEGSLYVAERGDPNYGAPPRVVKMGILTGTNGTLCCGADQLLGTGWAAPQGVAVDRSGNVFVADIGDGNVYELPWTSTGYGAKTQIAAGLYALQVAVDSQGNVFAASPGDSYTPQRGVYEIPKTSNGYGSPTKLVTSDAVGVAVDGSGNVYYYDSDAGHVVRLLLTLTGNTYGPGVVVASPGSPGSETGLAVDAAGNIFVGSPVNSDVIRVDTVDPPSLQFAATTVLQTTDTADGPQTLKLYNTGTAALAFASSSASDPSYPVQFPANTADASLCTSASPLAQGSACDISANFLPQVNGPISGSITVLDNSVTGSTQTVAVSGTGGQGQQTITISGPASPMIFTSNPFTVTATSTSGLPVTLVGQGPATFQGNGSQLSVSLLSTGTLTFEAFQAGNQGYPPASATLTIVVNVVPQVQTITFPAPATPVIFSANSITLAATASSGLPVTYTTSGPANVAPNSSQLFLLGAGTVVVTANQAGNVKYSAATSVSRTIVVANPTAAPTFSLASGTYSAAQTVTLGDSTKGAAIYYTIDGSAPTASSAIYTEPLQVGISETIRAIAILNGISSTGSSAAFIINTSQCQTINYSKGFTSAGLALNGGATVNNSALQITDGNRFEARSAYFATEVPVTRFTTDFTVQIINPVADGMTFVVQSNSAKALGQGGGGLGYAGIPHSIAFKLDLHNNSGEGTDSTGMYVNGASPTTPAIDLAPAGIDLHSGHIFAVHIAYANAVTSGTITDTVTGASATGTFPGDISQIVGSNAFVGFAGGTGNGSAKQNVLTWSFSGGANCPVK
jgi:sugar lactone lactonase YvrE